MSVKPITNPNPPQPRTVNRGRQVSRKSDVSRSSNDQKTALIGNNYEQDFEISLKDLDTSLMNHIKNIMALKIIENGTVVDVPVLYGNEERWHNVRARGYLRDKNGVILMPLIMFKRMSVEFNDQLPSYKHDVYDEYTGVLRYSNYSNTNQYDNWAVQQGIKPVEEQILTSVPQYVNITYDFMIMSNFIESQMNTMMEAFVEQHNTYWGDNTSYKFFTTVEGGINDSTEMSVDTERLVKNQFTVMLRGYLIPEYISNLVRNQEANARKQLTARKITISEHIQ
jgi:hypothetical protein